MFDHDSEDDQISNLQAVVPHLVVEKNSFFVVRFLNGVQMYEPLYYHPKLFLLFSDNSGVVNN